MTVREAVIVSAVRTPVGRRGGVLSAWHPADLLGHTLRHLVDRAGVHPVLIDDVIAGCVLQHEQQSSNIARHAVLSAGLPESVPAVTVDRQCGSGQQAVNFAAQGVIAGPSPRPTRPCSAPACPSTTSTASRSTRPSPACR